RTAGSCHRLTSFLQDWDTWCPEILEAHISYPIVAFFRSQHQKQSWVSALTTILDVSALVIAGIDGVSTWRARVTFAIARHAAVDLSQILQATFEPAADRLPDDALERMLRQLEAAGVPPGRAGAASARLRELRRSYEPYVGGLASALMMPLPAWWREQPRRDNWQTSPRRDAHL